MKYSKHYIQIADFTYDIGDSISLDEELKRTFQTMSLTLPYITTEQWNTTGIKRYDVIKLYYKEFNTAYEAEQATVADCDLIFDGYISEIEKPNFNKTTGRSINLQCKTTMGLSYERSTQIKFFNANISTFLEKALNETNLFDSIPQIYVQGLSDNLILKIDSTTFFGNVVDNIREKYVFNAFQNRTGELYIKTPFYMSQQTTNTRIYDLETNIFDFNDGSASSKSDCIIVLGTECIGIAFDPISYQLKNGITDSVTTPDLNLLNPEYIFRRDIFNQEEAQEVARNVLLERAKNYTISFDTIFDPTLKPGEPFLIRNVDTIPENQTWITKKITTTLGKSEKKSTIVAYSHSLSDFPEDILLSPSGLLDTDILGVREKVDSTLEL